MSDIDKNRKDTQELIVAISLLFANETPQVMMATLEIMLVNMYKVMFNYDEETSVKKFKESIGYILRMGIENGE